MHDRAKARTDWITTITQISNTHVHIHTHTTEGGQDREEATRATTRPQLGVNTKSKRTAIWTKPPGKEDALYRDSRFILWPQTVTRECEVKRTIRNYGQKIIIFSPWVQVLNPWARLGSQSEPLIVIMLLVFPLLRTYIYIYFSLLLLLV